MTSPRHGLPRMLAIMERHGSITPTMADAATALAELLGRGLALDLPGRLGPPAAECLFAVLRDEVPLRHWAKTGWFGKPLNQDTAAGILIAALGALAHGNARLLLDDALAAAARRGLGARPLALHDRRLHPPGHDRRPYPDPAAGALPDPVGPHREPAHALCEA
jgi:hypothetical protein